MSCDCQVKDADPSKPCPSCGAKPDPPTQPEQGEESAFEKRRTETLMMMMRPPQGGWKEP